MCIDKFLVILARSASLFLCFFFWFDRLINWFILFMLFSCILSWSLVLPYQMRNTFPHIFWRHKVLSVRGFSNLACSSFDIRMIPDCNQYSFSLFALLMHSQCIFHIEFRGSVVRIRSRQGKTP